MATLPQELSQHLRAALKACGDLGAAIGDNDGAFPVVTRAHAKDAAERLELVAASIRRSVAKDEVEGEERATRRVDEQVARLRGGDPRVPGARIIDHPAGPQVIE